MTMLPELERELVRAAERRRPPSPEPASRFEHLRVVLVLTAVAAVVVAVAAVFTTLRSRHGGSSPSATARRLTAVRPVIEQTIRVRSGVVDLAYGSNGLWAVGFGAVSRLDPASGRVVATIRTPYTGDDSSIAAGKTGVWVTAGRSRGLLYRIDPARDRVVARVHVSGLPMGVALGGGSVWVTVIPRSGPGALVRIDPRTDRVIGAPLKVGPGPGQVIYATDAVWVANTSPFSVVRVDPASRAVKTIVGPGAVAPGSPVVGGIGVAFGSLWVASNDSLIRLDLKTFATVATVPMPRALLVAFGAGRVWVLAEPRSKSATLYLPIKGTERLWQVDPDTNERSGKPLALGGVQPIALASTGDSLWLADYNRRTVTRVLLLRNGLPVCPPTARCRNYVFAHHP